MNEIEENSDINFKNIKKVIKRNIINKNRFNFYKLYFL